MVELYIYINGQVKRIDIFDDEPISITSTLQNINDISKVFTDYSQSFSVPVSKNNNLIFSHWYNNEVDNGFDQRLRYDGYIEIDSQVFRVGRWQIESSDVTKSYKITFFGVLKSLSDRFGEDKLKDLDYSTLDFEYNFTNVLDLVKFANDNVQFPLISSNRVWQYGGGGSLDISQNSHAIDYRELFPAVAIKKIFDLIALKYNVNFNGNFLSSQQFKNVFLWFKNKETIIVQTSYFPVDLVSKTSFLQPLYTTIDLTNNSILFNRISVFAKVYLKISVNCPVSSVVKVLRDNILYTEINYESGISDYVLLDNLPNGLYTFDIKTSATATANLSVIAGAIRYFPSYVDSNDTITATATTTGIFDFNDYAPDLTVKDFMNGIIKSFNFVIESFDEVNYKFIPLNEWYLGGENKDFTEYTQTEIEIERVKSFKKIDFKNKESKSFLNVALNASIGRTYGDLSYTFDNEGSDYKIETPFEALAFRNLSGNLTCAYSIDKDGKPYIPAPCLIYRTSATPQTVPTFYITGSPATAITSCINFSRFFEDTNQNTFSLDFGAEWNMVKSSAENNSLFWLYYFDYINNLYQKKSRMAKVKMILPVTELIKLKLNDRIIINGKRYLINQFTTNFLKNEISMELINDFRETLLESQFFRTTGGGTVRARRIDGDNDFNTIDDINGIIQTLTYTDEEAIIDIYNTTGVASVISNKGVIIIENEAI